MATWWFRDEDGTLEEWVHEVEGRPELHVLKSLDRVETNFGQDRV